MFTVYAHTDKMEKEGKRYSQFVTSGSWGKAKRFYDTLIKQTVTDRCKIVRDKDKKVMAEYTR